MSTTKPVPSFRLRPTSGGAHGGGGRPVPMGSESISIGRHPSNTISITDDRASRQHCVIERASDGEGGFVLRDLESRNGTKLNGLKITEVELCLGDVIGIGSTEFLIEEGVATKGKPAATKASRPSRTGQKPRLSANTRKDNVGTDQGAEGDAKGTLDPEITKDLERMLKSLPPKDEPWPSVALVQADGSESDVLKTSGAGGGGAVVTRMVLQVASKARATDVHVEPQDGLSRIRLRVDGQMVWIADLPRGVGDRLCGLIKTACQLKVTHSQAMLDGHFSARIDSRRVEYRVSFTPSMQGQKLVIRVLDTRGVPTSLRELGLLPWMEERVRRVCEKDSGILLTVGPTGSGKTTTLYNCLRSVDRERRNVVTIEDPIEYQLDGVTQIPINAQRGNTFGDLLRSVLRQDPDVILVGEIRDGETARTAMQAAMTGHVVFSTLHAKNSISAVFRLLDLGIEPYLLANALDLILAQRLVRVLCKQCCREIPIKPGQASRMGHALRGKTVSKMPVGCAACLKTGYRGRAALFELLEFNDAMRDVVLGTPTVGAMKQVIANGHFTTLTEFGWRLVADGTVSIEEIERVSEN